MAVIPPELQDELKSVADLPQHAALQEALEGHVNLAHAKALGNNGDMGNLFNSIMIAAEDKAEADKLAQVYAKSLSFHGLVEEDKIVRLDWKTIFNTAASRADAAAAVVAKIDQALADADGGVLVISEPYQCPESMSPRDFSLANYNAIAHLMEKMDEMDVSFDDAFDDLYGKGKDLGEIEQQMLSRTFENPRKPVVIITGDPESMNSMVAEDPHPWNLRFMHKIGITKDAQKGIASLPFGKTGGKPFKP